jgi:hypothetical protein
MAILAVKTDRMDITWDLSSGYILVQQKWRYNWINEPGVAPWSYQETLDFHNRADKWIWDMWSSKAYAMILGNSKLAQEYRNTKFKINVDIRWVVGKEHEHWNVYVNKKDKDAYVIWDYRQIKLSIQDIDYGNTIGRVDSTMHYAQIGVAHEFGHAFGNSPHALRESDPGYPMHGNEYEEPSLSKYRDDASIMGVANTVRQRHFDYLKIQLKNLINQDVEIYNF